MRNKQDQQVQQQQQQQQQEEDIYEDATTGPQQSDAHSRFSKLYFFYMVILIKQKARLGLGFYSSIILK